MIDLSNFKINHKYFISLLPPFGIEPLNLRIIVNKLEPKSRPELVDYITFSTLKSTKDIIDECGLNQVAVPLPCITKVETLHNILDNILIDDIIYLINEYI